MTDRNEFRVELSAEGKRRRNDIERSLLSRIQHRRLGSITMGIAACALAGVAGVVGMRGVSSRSEPTAPRIAENSPERQAPARIAAEPSRVTDSRSPRARSEVRIAIVANDPIPDQPCSQVDTSTRSGTPSTDPAICVLTDSELLSVLTQTGKSYGLVRVDGKTHVVLNSTGD